jgi:methylglutamate dehydrogenase subunit A
MRYSVFSLARNALNHHRDWPQAWRSPAPKPAYDVIIVGGGGHGLATAYYLAKEHGITNVAVIEKGWLGGGNTGRNTTIVRSNYLLDENALFYEWSLKLWEGLSQDLNYNVMFSPRGVINLAHSDAQRDAFMRRGNAMRLNGIDSEWIELEQLQRMVPLLDCSANARYPIVGGLMQRRGGTARHDAVAWGFARGADQRGVDIIQNCEVTGFTIEQGRVVGVETTKGKIRAGKVGLAVAGHTGVLAGKAGFRLPIESHLLQAFVSEPLKPFLDTVVTFGAGHFYVSQSDKGELVMGGDLDFYNSYAQRGNLPIIEDAVRCGLAMFPSFSRSAPDAPLGRRDGHVDGRQPDHRQVAGRESLPQHRLVLRRLQGDSGLGLGLRAHHRDRRAASAQRRADAGSLRRRTRAGREGRRSGALGALRRGRC